MRFVGGLGREERRGIHGDHRLGPERRFMQRQHGCLHPRRHALPGYAVACEGVGSDAVHAAFFAFSSFSPIHDPEEPIPFA